MHCRNPAFSQKGAMVTSFGDSCTCRTDDPNQDTTPKSEDRVTKVAGQSEVMTDDLMQLIGTGSEMAFSRDFQPAGSVSDSSSATSALMKF